MYDSRELDAFVAQYTAMGFDTEDIILAFLGTSRKTMFLDNLVAINASKKNQQPPKRENSKNLNGLTESQRFESEIDKAIRLSLEEEDEKVKVRPPTEIKRVGDAPVGLKNIGNTCYFNSLIQTLFQIKEFVAEIFEYKEPENLEALLAKIEASDEVKERQRKSVSLIKSLKRLFGLMISGNRKFLNPTEVFSSICDSQGKAVKKGEQLDFSEFCINFMERVAEGLSIQDNNATRLSKSNQSDNLCGSIIMNDTNKIENYIEDKDEKNTKSNGSIAQELVSNLFFGVSKDYITFDWSDYKTKKNQDAVFGPLNIDLGPKTLMRSLETFYNFSIDGYKCPDGEITTAKKKCWIAKPPKILSFILRRVEYDAKSAKLTKNHGEFTFDKEINLDKFLLENKKKLNETGKVEDIKSLKQKEKDTEAELNSLLNSDSKGNSAEYLLRQANKFITNQLSHLQENDFVDIDTSGEADEKLTCSNNKKELEAASATLGKLQDRIHKRVNELEDRKLKIKKKMEKANCELTHLKYRLYSIIVHMGSKATSGHYFTYLYNFKNKKWNRISDESVQEVTEEEVFKISKGENYYFTSANSIIQIQEDGMQPHGHNTQDLQDLVKNMDKNLEAEVKKENQKFEIEHSQYNSNFIKTVYDEYLMRMNRFSFEASNYLSENGKKTVPSLPVLTSFNSFIMLDPKLSKELARWNALNDILTSSNVPYNVLQGDKNNFYYKELERAIVNQGCVYNLNSLELDFSSNSVYNSKKKEFMSYYKTLVVLKKTFNFIINRKWKEATIGVSLIGNLLSDYKPQEYNKHFYSFASYILVLLSMKLCSLIDMTYFRGDLQEVLQLQKILIYSLTQKKAIKPAKIFYSQIQSNLNYVLDVSAGKKPQDSEMFIFQYMNSKLEEESDFTPLGDVSGPLIKDLIKELEDIDKNSELIFCPTFTMDSSLKDLYQRAVNDRLSLWVEFEEHIRKKGQLVSQETRVDKEALTFPSEL